MKVNWRRFLLLFAVFEVVFLCAGCTAAWLSAVSALLPAFQTAVGAALSFILALEGKTVPASVSSAVQKLFSDVGTQITNAQALIADFKNAATSAQGSLLAQIGAVFQGIITNLNSILAGFNVTDSATVTKFTQLVTLCVAAAQAILGLIPLVAAKLASGASEQQLAAEDKAAADHIKSAEKQYKEAYHVIVSTPTESAEVNVALASLPQSV